MQYAKRIAAAKLAAVAPRHPGCFVLAADTVVACGRRILPKAEDQNAARRCLELLCGRRHHVLGAVTISAPDGKRIERLVDTSVIFKRLSDAEIGGLCRRRRRAGARPVATPCRAGRAVFVRAISGSYSNVVGLSLYDVGAMLTGLGFKIEHG